MPPGVSSLKNMEMIDNVAAKKQLNIIWNARSMTSRNTRKSLTCCSSATNLPCCDGRC